MTSRSPAHRGRGRGARPGAPEAARTRFGSVLALQRMAGNRAVRALIAREPKVIKVGDEQVRVASDAEKAEAERIIRDAKANFGVTFDSIAAKRATLAHYPEGSVRDDMRKGVDVRPWDMDELKAVERALKHFAPVLGDARKKSSLKDSPQEFTTVGKLTTAPDDDPKMLGDKTRGQYFREAQDFAVFEPGPDPPVEADYVERVATHELAHGIFDPHLDAFMKATGYWSAQGVKSKARGAEGPPDSYADKNAKEDLAQSVMYFFVDPKRLKEGDKRGRGRGTWGNPCPKRFDFIKNVVAGWTPKGKR